MVQVAGETGLELYEGVAACLARDRLAAAERGSSGPAALLRPSGAVFFQVEWHTL
jgi:hypothetical protein